MIIVKSQSPYISKQVVNEEFVCTIISLDKDISL